MQSYFVTGATGLIGRHLLPHLIARGGRVIALVLPGSRARHAQLIASWGDRVEVVEGDVTIPGLGLTRELPPLHHVVHAAALYDLAAPAEEVDRVNVDGTRHLIALLKDRGFEGVLHHVSSIAVAGDFEGDFGEADLDRGQGHPTPYHRSKLQSEKEVRASGLRVRIYRPSAVVGHSKTGETLRADGPYCLFGPMLSLRNNLPRWFPMALPTTAGPVNMVPVDWVARTIDALAHEAGRDGVTYHVVDAEPPSFMETFNLLADAAGAPRAKKSRLGKLATMVATGYQLGELATTRSLRDGWLDALDIPREVRAAFNRGARYDTANLRAALNGAHRAPPQAEYMPALWDYWLRHLEPRRGAEAVRRYLAGKVVLVTGASSGIGAAVAKACARAGSVVVLTARREAELSAVVAEIESDGGRASSIIADLADMDACDRVARLTLERHGHVDILFNNAGRSIRRPLAESIARFHDFERVMQLNFFAPVRLMRGLLPSMRERGTGHVVNVLSAGALMPAPRFGVYTASKAALGQVGDTLEAELVGEGIHVTNAYLSWVRTPMMDPDAYRDVKAMTPQDAATWMLEGVARRARRVISAEVKRRSVMAELAPGLSSRVMNAVYRVYADVPEADPEFALDRSLAKRFIKSRLV